MSEPDPTKHDQHVELDLAHEDRIVRTSNLLIRQGIRLLSIVMVVVIFFAIMDTAYTFVIKMISPPMFVLEVSDLLDVFGAVLVVLIAVEIYSNVTLYLTANVIHVKLVVATA